MPELNNVLTRSQILVRGIVQGVGFRPFVYSQASRRALRGHVLNSPHGVVIEVEGSSADIEQFVLELQSSPPPLSSIDSIECLNNLTPANFSEFRIAESEMDEERFVPISSDIATCVDCLAELFDPQDRRYRYPFINCTNCGPRFTIIEDIPYDRARTTMRDFAMCEACRTEYENPFDRRFHAEPTACAECGPRLFLFDSGRRDLFPRSANDQEILDVANSMIDSGKILAVKSLGGYHLVCDALDHTAVANLRNRKYREDKPFALMAPSIDVIERYCEVSGEEKALLQSEARPIVLLQRNEGEPLPAEIAPKVKTLGFMLPYTPLHHLLFVNRVTPLVFTSANVSDEPICFDDTDAFSRLGKIADYFLTNDRGIRVRCDDSVARIANGREVVLRRSRGYAPAPIRTATTFTQHILACGAELKNTFCLARDNYAFVSQHIGDLENLETLEAYRHGVEHCQRLFHLDPTVIAYDLHPEYLSTKYALGQPDDLLKIGVQHHHAHIASCLADNNEGGDVIGVAMDGLGYGLDGTLWGGEFLLANFFEAERKAHLRTVALPGGVKAIKEPWRMAAIYLQESLGEEFVDLPIPFCRELDDGAWKTLRRMTKKGINSPLTSSMGRLFDAISALLQVREFVNYEGQAAVELESIADQAETEAYRFGFNADGTEISAVPVVRQVVNDLLEDLTPARISARFHLGVARMIAAVAIRMREQSRINRVALSGGVFQNMFLLGKTSRALAEEGFVVLTHRRVPPNDGGISLGQAVIANERINYRRA